jgi:LysM repeat protein
MTVLGIDISHWSSLATHPVDLHEQGYDFLFWKATEGSTYYDPTFGNMDSRYGNVLTAAFHYMDDSDADKQVANIRSVVPLHLPVIVDMEAGSIYTAQRIHASLQRAGYSTPIFYLPQWYWTQVGRPDISHFPPLWASVRVKGSGYGSDLYQSLSPQNWGGYGGNNPVVLQFTQNAKVDGCASPLDVSAFGGSREDLQHLLHSTTVPGPVPDPVFYYTVIAGDTLWDISFFTLGNAAAWKDIATANQLSNPNRLFPGQRLLIPGWDGVRHGYAEANTYTVRAGNTLTSIASHFGMSVMALYNANRLAIGRDPDNIHPGLVLLIPAIR